MLTFARLLVLGLAAFRLPAASAMSAWSASGKCADERYRYFRRTFHPKKRRSNAKGLRVKYVCRNVSYNSECRSASE